ncbi:N-formylglutamate amidohydrolase [Dinoroseobacter sp. S124A]|uniref:N-formylglutamate amidohydrolase n=1 Tax=Dinoroseobacter sp. S124A TaxID=3415128 RepID=UPI003C7BEA2A
MTTGLQTDGPAFLEVAGPAQSDWVLVCDHARNRVPITVAGGDLGLPAEDMARHIAFDPGAEGVTRALAAELGAPAVISTFSRLVIDPNRSEDDPTLLMRLYDGTIIPGNRHADATERARRIADWHRPYHDAVGAMLLRHPEALLVSIHSFTPQLRGRAPRPWHIGVLYAEDARLARPFIAAAEGETDLCVGDNKPYSGHLPGDTMDRHGVQPGRPHVLIELRNDLISTPETQSAWGRRLAGLLQVAKSQMEET